MIYLPYVGIGMLFQLALFVLQPPFVWAYSMGAALIAIVLPTVLLRTLKEREALAKQGDHKNGHHEQNNPDRAIGR